MKNVLSAIPLIIIGIGFLGLSFGFAIMFIKMDFSDYDGIPFVFLARSSLAIAFGMVSLAGFAILKEAKDIITG